MNKIISVAICTLALSFTASTVLAQEPAAAVDCAAKAVSKEGKPLTGAAKAASMKKCERENPSTASAAPAAAEGKSAQQSKMKTCNKDAAGKKGDERKAFMKECLSAK